jgi:hypothetical protein
MEHRNDHNSPNPGHELQDIEYSWGTWLVPVAIALLLLFTITVYFLTSGAASAEMNAKRLQGVDAPRAQLLGLRAQEDSLLNGYGQDSAGRARIPVDSAIKILSTRSGNP